LHNFRKREGTAPKRGQLPELLNTNFDKKQVFVKPGIDPDIFLRKNRLKLFIWMSINMQIFGSLFVLGFSGRDL